MKNFLIKDLNSPEKREALKTNKDILAFAENFNSDKYQRDPKFISGMGAYKLESWTSGQEVTLVRKDKWWGDQFKDQRAFWAFPKKIKFKVINDQSAAISALKNGQLDEFTAVPAKDFNEMKKNEAYLKKFNFVETDMFYLSTLIINNRLEKFKDVKVRKALTLAVDRDKINKIIFDGKYQKAVSIVHPKQKAFNNDLKPYEFNIEASNKLLDEAGWRDQDGDGIREKMLNGKKIPLTVEFKYNAGNEQRKNTALILKEDFKKIGVQLEITAKEAAVIQKETENYNFEMCYVAYGIPANMSDPKQQWHTSSAVNGGDNKSGFGNLVSDRLIDNIDKELNENKRNQFYVQLQQNIYDACPVIFLFYAKNRLIYSSKFKVKTHMINDCVNFNEFAPAN
jgi:peptide/nickel transport system substrate-binding protein